MESSGNRPRIPPVSQTPQTQRPATAARPGSATSPATPHRPALPTKVITPETDLLTVAKTTAQWAESKRNYLKFAFANPYNLSLLTAGLAAAVLTLNPFVAVATLGLAGLWMVRAPESSFLP